MLSHYGVTGGDSPRPSRPRAQVSAIGTLLGRDIRESLWCPSLEFGSVGGAKEVSDAPIHTGRVHFLSSMGIAGRNGASPK